MKNLIAAMVTLAGLMLTSVSAQAVAIVGLIVEGGGTQQVYALDNGNYLGLWGFDNREGANPGAAAVDINSLMDITNGFISGGGNIVNYYNGTNPINGGASEFDPLSVPFTIADNARLFDSLWIEWTGGNLVYQQPSGGTSTMNSTNITRDGDPLANNDVPEPGTLMLLGAGLVGLGAARRKRSAA